jgi:hypothetical protein
MDKKLVISSPKYIPPYRRQYPINHESTANDNVDNTPTSRSGKFQDNASRQSSLCNLLPSNEETLQTRIQVASPIPRYIPLHKRTQATIFDSLQDVSSLKQDGKHSPGKKKRGSIVNPKYDLRK